MPVVCWTWVDFQVGAGKLCEYEQAVDLQLVKGLSTHVISCDIEQLPCKAVPSVCEFTWLVFMSAKSNWADSAAVQCPAPIDSALTPIACTTFLECHTPTSGIFGSLNKTYFLRLKSLKSWGVKAQLWLSRKAERAGRNWAAPWPLGEMMCLMRTFLVVGGGSSASE